MTGDELIRWRRLCYLQACLALEAFSAPILVLFYTSYAGFTFAEYSAVISLIFVFLWALEIPTGAFADRYGRKRALVAGNVVYIVAMFCLIHFGRGLSPWVIAFLFACGGALSNGAFQSMMFDAFAAKGRDADFHTVNARATSLAMLSGGAASAMGGWFASRSLALPMYVDMGILAILTVSFMVWVREPIREHPPQRPGIVDIAREGAAVCISCRPLLVAILLAAVTFACLRAGFNFYQPLLQAGRVNVEKIGWIFAAMYAFSAATAYAFSHVRKSTLLSRAPSTVLILMFAAAAFLVAISGALASLGWVLLAIACHQIVRGMYPSYTAYLINRSLPAGALNRTTILSAASLVRAVCTALFVWTSGMVADRMGFVEAFVALSAFAAILVGTLSFFRGDTDDARLSAVSSPSD
ncbi:MFS transporter [Burkholderia anthina]|uniref:MFS transporter n=1 Tax=Burkholderia anthina TaxID=179879 RepID=UPI001AA01E0C|nr:MFS transporter [Burkholderia anthina]QTD89946.1 MFS transporter [Burkholderia anthina]